MIRLENRSGEMEIFVGVVNAGSFSAAAARLQMTPSAVSKLMSRLETRLGARLINRSTRKLQLTAEGAEFYQRCLNILSDIEEAESCVSHAEMAAGRVNVNVSVPVGMRIILPLVSAFLKQYPRVSLNLQLTDEVVNLLDINAEVAIRSGRMKDSRLSARKLGATPMTIVASPGYLQTYGIPKTPQDLENHNRLGHHFAREMNGWPFTVDGKEIVIPINGNAQVSNGEALRLLCVEGLGMARLANFLIADDVEAGRLVPVLQDYNPGDLEEIHAVYISQGGPLPHRIRVFIDYLADNIAL